MASSGSQHGGIRGLGGKGVPVCELFQVSCGAPRISQGQGLRVELSEALAARAPSGLTCLAKVRMGRTQPGTGSRTR